jgi:hypothetical protein
MSKVRGRYTDIDIDIFTDNFYFYFVAAFITYILLYNLESDAAVEL